MAWVKTRDGQSRRRRDINYLIRSDLGYFFTSATSQMDRTHGYESTDDISNTPNNDIAVRIIITTKRLLIV